MTSLGVVSDKEFNELLNNSYQIRLPNGDLAIKIKSADSKTYGLVISESARHNLVWAALAGKN